MHAINISFWTVLLLVSFFPSAATAGCIKGDCKEGYGVYTWETGDKYVGHFKEGLTHGKGKYTWANGATHDGNWKMGQQHGYGNATYPVTRKDGWDGNYSTGEIQVLPYRATQVFVGYFENGLRHGRGKDTAPGGESYDGDYYEGRRVGQGTLQRFKCKYTSVEGDVYEGQWANDKEHGHGKEAYADGDMYEGEWKLGKKTGRGKYTAANGDVYDARDLRGDLRRPTREALRERARKEGKTQKKKRKKGKKSTRKKKKVKRVPEGRPRTSSEEL